MKGDVENKFSFKQRVVELGNTLPDEMVETDMTSTCKKNVGMHLNRQQMERYTDGISLNWHKGQRGHRGLKGLIMYCIV